MLATIDDVKDKSFDYIVCGQYWPSRLALFTSECMSLTSFARMQVVVCVSLSPVLWMRLTGAYRPLVSQSQRVSVRIPRPRFSYWRPEPLMWTTWRFVSILSLCPIIRPIERWNPVRPASYGSHFGNFAYTWDHNTVRPFPFPHITQSPFADRRMSNRKSKS